MKTIDFNKSLMKTCLAVLILAVIMLATNQPIQAQVQRDYIFIIDVTGSTWNWLSKWQASMPGWVAAQQAALPGVRFGLVTHKDFPFSPYGGTGDYAYQMAAALNSNPANFLAAVAGLSSSGGGDGLESQYVTIFHTLSETGLDMNMDFDYVDQGEFPANQIGILAGREIRMIILTDQKSFHDRDTDSNYPYAGASNVPGRTTCLTEVLTHPLTTYALYTGSWLKSDINPQTGEPYSEDYYAADTTHLQELCIKTNGHVILMDTVASMDVALDYIATNQPRRVPSLTGWGLAVLLVLLILSSIYVIARKRRLSVS
nr:hypothetical protein [candidate division Zixibacteria bacterium]